MTTKTKTEKKELIWTSQEKENHKSELLNQRYGDTILLRPKPKSESESKNRAKKSPQNF